MIKNQNKQYSQIIRFTKPEHILEFQKQIYIKIEEHEYNIRNANQIMPENNKRVVELVQNAKFQQFIQAFEKTQQETIKPFKITNFYNNYIHLAIAHLQLGKFQASKAICQRMIEKSSEDEDAHMILAISLAHMNQFQKGLNLCNERLAVDNRKWKAYFAKGYLFAKMQKHKQAIQSYGIAIIKNKRNNPKSYILQAGCLASMDENQKAMKNMTYAKNAIQEDQTKNCQNLYKYQIENIKACLTIFNRYTKKLRKSRQVNQINDMQRISFENSLIKIISKSVQYCSKKLNNKNKIQNKTESAAQKNNDKQSQSEQGENLQSKIQGTTSNFFEDLKAFDNALKLKSVKSLQTQQTQRDEKSSKVICQWMRSKCSIF